MAMEFVAALPSVVAVVGTLLTHGDHGVRVFASGRWTFGTALLAVDKFDAADVRKYKCSCRKATQRLCVRCFQRVGHTHEQDAGLFRLA
jgi:hypothetical protein